MALVFGTVTGWCHATIGASTWAWWTVSALAILIGLPIAWFSTPLGPRTTTTLPLALYHREGIQAVQLHLSRVTRQKAGIQLFNLALALDREGDRDGAEAVSRRAVDYGSPPAMLNLAYRLNQSGEYDEAHALQRRAAEAD